MSVAKPQLRNLMISQLKMHFVGMTVFSFSIATLYKVFVGDWRKKKYAEFYKTYDAEKQLKIMCDAGLMQSCPETYIA